MTPQEIKEYIYDNDKIQYILEQLQMHHIKWHGQKYITCGFPDGDNTKSTVIWNDKYLNVSAYTRDIKDKYDNSDIFSLISFIKKMYFYEAVKWICKELDLNYYGELDKDLPESLKITRMIIEMDIENQDPEENEKVKPINEEVLKYYGLYVNDLFKKDGINYDTQRFFHLGYDSQSNRITIPIRDELGTLVGVKGRLLKKELDETEQKYIYLEPCAKTKICFGLNIALSYIIKKQEVIVVESEKSVMKLWQEGIFNCVAIGGHDLSKVQVEKLTRLGIKEIILCYDEDVGRKKNGKISYKMYQKEVNKFIPQQKVTCMVDIDRKILNKKESPADDMKKFKILYKDRKEIKR